MLVIVLVIVTKISLTYINVFPVQSHLSPTDSPRMFRSVLPGPDPPRRCVTKFFSV